MFWEKQKEKNIKQLEALISGKEDPSINKIDEYFGTMIKPKNFYGPRNAELRHDKSFEKNCILLAQYSNTNVKKCTTKEYFALLEHHNEIIKEKQRAEKRSKI